MVRRDARSASGSSWQGTAEGAEETYRLTDRAVHETGKGLKEGTKTTIYYTEEGGKKIGHFFAS